MSLNNEKHYLQLLSNAASELFNFTCSEKLNTTHSIKRVLAELEFRALLDAAKISDNPDLHIIDLFNNIQGSEHEQFYKNLFTANERQGLPIIRDYDPTSHGATEFKIQIFADVLEKNFNKAEGLLNILEALHNSTSRGIKIEADNMFKFIIIDLELPSIERIKKHVNDNIKPILHEKGYDISLNEDDLFAIYNIASKKNGIISGYPTDDLGYKFGSSESLSAEQYNQSNELNTRINCYTNLIEKYHESSVLQGLQNSNGGAINVLDIGCGSGEVSLAIAQKLKNLGYNINYTLLDKDRTAVENAEKLFLNNNIEQKEIKTVIELFSSDVDNPSINKQQYSLVIVSHAYNFNSNKMLEALESTLQDSKTITILQHENESSDKLKILNAARNTCKNAIVAANKGNLLNESLQNKYSANYISANSTSAIKIEPFTKDEFAFIMQFPECGYSENMYKKINDKFNSDEAGKFIKKIQLFENLVATPIESIKKDDLLGLVAEWNKLANDNSRPAPSHLIINSSTQVLISRELAAAIDADKNHYAKNVLADSKQVLEKCSAVGRLIDNGGNRDKGI